MKTIIHLSFAILIVGLLSIACQRDDHSPNLFDAPIAADSSLATVSSWNTCSKIVIPSIYIFDHRTDFSDPSKCIPELGFICERRERLIELPCIYFYIPELTIPPSCLSCPPWELFKRIPSYRLPDFRQINPGMFKSGVNAVMFPLTKSAIGIQFYLENNIINRKVFTLRKDVHLTVEQQKALGVSGNKIPAGNYPVIHNIKNNTINAIVRIQSIVGEKG